MTALSDDERREQTEQVARAFGVPAELVGEGNPLRANAEGYHAGIFEEMRANYEARLDEWVSRELVEGDGTPDGILAPGGTSMTFTVNDFGLANLRQAMGEGSITTYGVGQQHYEGPVNWPGGTDVQHCNTRTGYELIRHPYRPDVCEECARLQLHGMRPWTSHGDPEPPLQPNLEPPEPRSHAMFDQKIIDQRLAANQCPWDGTPISDDSPDATFCSQVCQDAWHAWKNGEPVYAPGPRPSQPYDETLTTPPTTAELNPRPERRPAAPLHAAPYITEGRDIEGIIPSEPQRAAFDDHTRIGGSQIGHKPALRTVDAPQPPPSYPAEQVGHMQRSGFKLYALKPKPLPARNAAQMMATIVDLLGRPRTEDEPPPVMVPDGPLPPSLACQGCGPDSMPIVRSRFDPPAIRLASVDDLQRALDDRPQATWHVVCHRCHHEYPPPVLVPMYRQDTSASMDAWQLAVAYTGGAYLTMVSGELIHRAGVDLSAVVWGDIYRGGTEGINPWGCCVPGCTGKSMQWHVLAAALQYKGWIWEPVDGEPLLLGMCPAHHHHLLQDLLTDPDSMHRAALPTQAGTHFVYM